MMRKVLFFDLDGVLCDFTSGALAFHGKTLPHLERTWHFPVSIGFASLEDPLFWDPLGYDFTFGLEPMQDGLQLLWLAEKVVGRDNIAILTHPWSTPGVIDGKKDWINFHLPEYSKRLFTGASKHMLSGPNKFLVDDNDGNCEKFVFFENEPTGGKSFLVPRAWNKRKPEVDERSGSFDVRAACVELEKLLNS